jgi:hypothetical protein
MKISLGVLCAVNVLISTAAISSLFFATDQRNKFDSAAARLVVREQLSKLSFLMPQSNLRISQSCAEQRGTGGTVTGKAEALNETSLIEGILMNRNMRFSYQAAVSARCDAYNLNCYDVNSIDVSGASTLSPKL